MLHASLRNFVLRGLPAAELDVIRPHLNPVRLVAGQELHEPDQPISEVFFIESGFASVMATVSGAAKPVELGLLGREAMTGLPIVLDAHAVAFDGVVVQSPGEAIRMSSGDLLDCLEVAPELRRRLHARVEMTLAGASQTSACTRVHGMPERLARRLLGAFDRTDGHELAVTHEYLAAALGCARPLVTHAMRKLAEQKVVRYGRSRLQLLDRSGLEHAACPCYFRLKALSERMRPQAGVFAELASAD